MSDPSTAKTDNDAFPPMPERIQFSLRSLLLWMTAGCAALATVYWLGSGALVLIGLVLIGYLPFHFGFCRLWQSSFVAVALAMIAVVFVPVCVIPRGVARRSTCSNNLKNILLALHNYHDTHGTFPPAYLADAKGRPMHSWRVLILPFMEQEKLYKKYRFDEPWDGPNNRQLHSEVVRLFRCPSTPGAIDGETSYLAVVGPQTVWPGDESRSMQDVKDNPDATLLIVEVRNSGIHWMEPRDLHVSQMATTINPKRGQGISSHHEQCAHVITVDGMPARLPDELPPQDLEALLTIDGGEQVELP